MLSLETLSLAKAYTDKIKEQLSVGFTPKIVESLPTLGQNNILSNTIEYQKTFKKK